MADLVIRLTPGAAIDRIDGWDVDAEGRPVLKVRLRARPIDGEANAALIRFLSKRLGLSASDISLARGGRSRLKRIALAGLDDSAVRARLTDP